MMKTYNLGVVGSTGAVGQEVFKVLEEMNLPINKVVPISSAKSEGKEIFYKDKTLINQALTPEVFKKNDLNIVIFSAGGDISKEYAPFAVEAGAVVVDNTSYFRMDKEVPLVVPEINPEDIRLYRQKGIIANPNCSTIQMVHILKPLDEVFDIERVDVSTYQSVSGAGNKAIKELFEQVQETFKLNKNPHHQENSVFPHQIAFNCIPQIDAFLPNGYTKEELKMINETQKILHKEIEVNATCVRVPVIRAHSEAVTIRFKKAVDLDEVCHILQTEDKEHIEFNDVMHDENYPMPIFSSHKNKTFVGRIRCDLYDPKILNLWIVADNLRVGAATNAVRIVQQFMAMNLGD